MTLIFAGGGFSFGSLGFFEEFLFRGYLQFTHIRCSATRARRSRLEQTVFKMEQFSGWCYSILFRNENERTHTQTIIRRPVSNVRGRCRATLCAAFRCSAQRTARRPEDCRY